MRFYIDYYVSKINSMADEIHNIGVVVNDGDLILIPLVGLDSSYSPLITTIATMADNITFFVHMMIVRLNCHRIYL